MRLNRQSQYGFTLVEMIIVIVITGIIGGMVAIFIRAPVQGYVDSARRAELTDIADTALRRLERDIRTAVPNSVRVANCGGTPTCVEFLPTRTGGRYRGAPATAGAISCGSYAAAVLDFNTTPADSCFEIIGTPLTFAAGDAIVVGSTQSDGNPPYDQTANGVLRTYAGTTGAPLLAVNFNTPALPAWAEVQGQRFDVVDGAQQAVTYACVGPLIALNANNDGQAQLIRYWSYGFRTTQLPPPAAVGAATAGSIGAIGHSEAVLADRVSGCEITYGAVNQRNGLLTIRLTITRGGEGVSLYNTVHVNNVP